MNHWLDSTIKNYENYFGKVDKPVVWEVGSRDGRDGVELAERIYNGKPEWFWSNATVVLFEPNPVQASIIRNEYPEAILYEVAASNTKGSAPFMVYHGDEGAIGSSSLDLNWKENDLPGHSIVVETDRLDNIIEDEEIDIMKIDVEGHSLEVLEGLGDKIHQIKVLHIETETWTNSDKAVKEFMTTKGFTLVDEAEQYSGMPDQVWVRERSY